MKGFLTTTKLAEIAGVSQPTILDAITKKTIYAIRTPGGHYRIPQEEASRFLFAQGADPKRLARKSMRILHFTGDPEQAVAVAAAVGGIDRCKLEVANNPFKAGVLLEKFVPDILILGMEDSRIEEEVLEHLVRDMGDTRPKILLLRRDVGALQGDAGARCNVPLQGVNGAGDGPGPSRLGGGADKTMPFPASVGDLRKALRKLVEKTDIWRRLEVMPETVGTV